VTLLYRCVLRSRWLHVSPVTGSSSDYWNP